MRIVLTATVSVAAVSSFLLVAAWWPDTARGKDGPAPPEEPTGVLRQGLVARVGEIGQGEVVPVGGIIMYWGAADALPKNYELCDGKEVQLPDSPLRGRSKPDLVDRFPKGAADVAGNLASRGPAVGQGGVHVLWQPGVGATNGHALTEPQMPRHTHNVKDKGHRHPGLRIVGGVNGTIAGIRDANYESWNTVVREFDGTADISEEPRGEGKEHSHSLPDSYRENRPAYTEVHFVMRVK